MPVNFLALPAYHSPDAPMQAWNMLGQGFDAIREGKKDSRLLDIKQQAQDRANKLADFQLAEQQRQRDTFDQMMQANPAWAAQLPPGTLDVVRMAGPNAGPQMAGNMLMRHPEMALERQKMGLQNRQLEEQIAQRRQMYPLQKQELEYKLKALEQKDPERVFMENLFKQMGPQPAPGAPQAQPRLQPQSFEGSPDPNLIRTQAGQPQQAPQQEEMVQVPGFPQPIPKRLAEAAQLALSKDKGAVIGEAVKKHELGKEARNEVDKRELKAIEGLSRIKQIASGFQDKWLTYENKAKQYGISWLDSFETLRSKLPPDQLKEHADYTAFVRDAMSNLTDGIKDATGAAMGIQEEGRIRAGLPDPQKDSPTQFKAKLLGTARELMTMQARTRYLRENGFRGQAWTGDGNSAEKALPVEQFRRMIDREGETLYRELKQLHPQAPDDQVKGAVRSQLKQKFGTDI